MKSVFFLTLNRVCSSIFLLPLFVGKSKIDLKTIFKFNFSFIFTFFGNIDPSFCVRVLCLCCAGSSSVLWQKLCLFLTKVVLISYIKNHPHYNVQVPAPADLLCCWAHILALVDWCDRFKIKTKHQLWMSIVKYCYPVLFSPYRVVRRRHNAEREFSPVRRKIVNYVAEKMEIKTLRWRTLLPVEYNILKSILFIYYFRPDDQLFCFSSMQIHILRTYFCRNTPFYALFH